MAVTCERMTLDPINGLSAVQKYHEFNVEDDGKSLADAMIAEYGSKDAAIEEMLYMTIVAAARNDMTTINGLACIRKYWRLCAKKGADEN